MDWQRIMILLRKYHRPLSDISTTLGHNPGWGGKLMNGITKAPKRDDAKKLCEMVMKFVPENEWPVDIQEYL